MPTYKVFYFNSRGRAEVSRLVLAQAGVKYEDIRFSMEEWQATYKAKSPFGFAPWLEVDGVQIGGTRPMTRYLAEELGLAGDDKVQNAQIASIADTFEDMFIESRKVFQEKDEARKVKVMEEYVSKSPKWLDPLESKASEDGWLYGNKVTWADFYVYNGLSLLGQIPNFPLDKYPKLGKMMKNVEALPNIAKWLKERPETQY